MNKQTLSDKIEYYTKTTNVLKNHDILLVEDVAEFIKELKKEILSKAISNSIENALMNENESEIRLISLLEIETIINKLAGERFK